MTLNEILKAKGGKTFLISPDANLKDAVDELVKQNVGSLIVVDPESEGGLPVGIITERDILHVCGSGKCALDDTKVRDVMSTELVIASPDDAIEHVMGVMTTKRIRHLPVCAEGKLIGMVSIGDVVKTQHDRLAMENKAMKDYIQS